MDGIILINKEKGVTSRDVVNQVSKKLNIKKVGHAGTLDPLATGLMIIGIGKGTKILDLLTLDDKEYIATVKIGIQTDSMDITGNIIEKKDNYTISKQNIIDALSYFSKEYEQTVPKYSAVKLNGKRLYEYARKNQEIELPKRTVKIYNLELLEFNQDEFKFKALVSKGTYIRSLIDDIGTYLNIPMTMKDLVRIKCGKFKLEDSCLVTDDYNELKLQDCLDFKIIKVTNELLLKKIKNGSKINFNNKEETVTFIDDDENIIAIYKKDKLFEFIPFKVF